MKPSNYDFPKYTSLRRQTSGASLRKSGAPFNNIIRTWWNKSKNLISNLFGCQPETETLPKIEISKKELFDWERKRKISGSNVYGETLYLITLTNRTNTIKHFLKLSVVFSDNSDVYTTIFLCAIDENKLREGNTSCNEDCKWYELFHFSDHPGRSSNQSGAIHLKTTLNINEIIETLIIVTPYVSFNYGRELRLVSSIPEQINPNFLNGHSNDLNYSLEEVLIRDTIRHSDTYTNKIDLDIYSHRLYLEKWCGRIGFIVDQYLYNEMSLFPVLHGLGWTEYPSPD